jgi:hypothetical protein
MLFGAVMPLHSHAFLGWTNRRFPTSLSSFLEQKAEENQVK